MTPRTRLIGVLVVAAIAVLGASLTGALLSPAGHSGASLVPTHVASTAAVASHTGSTQTVNAPGAAAAASLMSKITSSHVDLEKIYPPNLRYAPTMRNGMIVQPSYPQAPEPAGLADYGVVNSSGTPKAITIDTTSYRASLSLNSVLPYYLTTGVPEGFTSQLNVVLQNVTLFGNSGYNFWTQNVLFYDAYSHQLFIENNIWNFSAYPAPQPVSTFLTNVTGYTNGTDNPSIGYYAAGTPTYDGITTPFSVMFYINATTYHATWGTDYTEVDFTFDLTYAGGAHTLNWMYDRVLFNNTGSTGPIPQAHFHVDGTNLTPTGFIPYDAEIMLGGPGGGSTATFYGLNATMTLQHWNATQGAYVNEPSAWSSGSETGETAVGVSGYYTADNTVHLGAGPEFIQPYWNSSATATAGAAVLSGTIDPSNAWAFVTNGASYNISNSAWGPLPQSGNYAWDLTQGTYSVKVMASDYDIADSSALALTSGTTTTFSSALTVNVAMGVYTPLYALSNGQLAAISSGGTGTEANPYMLVNNELTNLSGEFAATNDYEFPAYAGISLWNTSAYVEIANPAPFLVDFWGTSLSTANYFGSPTSDNLAIWLYETSHVSIVGGTISGWTSYEQTGFPYADLVIWNSTSTLVAGVTFLVTDVGILTYGGTGNSIVGNAFLYSAVTGLTMLPVGYIYPYEYGLGPISLIENEGGDSIWNNYFDTPFTALETNYNVYDDLYPSVPYSYTNTWNLTAPTPASTVTVINGVSLTGAVGAYPYACGNWWYDYAPGTTLLPYDENVGIALITTGGDYCPAGSLGSVVFAESGLPTGTAWSVTVSGGGSLSGTSPSLEKVLASGSYSFTVGAVAGYSAAPASGSVSVVAQGGVTTVSVVFTSTATGTLAGTVTPATANVTIDGAPVTLTSGAFSTAVSAGTHAIVASAAGYYTYYNNVTVSSGATTTVAISLNPVTPPPGPDGSLSLTVSPSSATVWVDGSAVTLSNGAYSASVTPGVHSIEVSASGYYTYYDNVTVKSSTTTSVPISLNAVSSSTTSSNEISSTGWAIIAVLAVLAVIFLVTTLVFMGRARKGPSGPSPPSGGGQS